MYTQASVFKLTTKLLIIFNIFTLINTYELTKTEIPPNCCPSGYLINDNLACVNSESNIVAEKVGEFSFKCPKDEALAPDKYIDNDNYSYLTMEIEETSCIADARNGTRIIARCVHQHDEAMLGFDRIIFWGAETYMPTNLAHIVLCFVVVIVYLSIPELGRGLYNRAVVRHNVCLLIQGLLLQVMACCKVLCCQIPNDLVIFLWLVQQYFTIATVFWLNSICFDMTLAIMRFRWIGGNGYNSGEVEARKLMMYSIFSWGGPLVPTMIAALCDYIPQVPNDFILKPNFVNYLNGPSPIINLYFFLLPMIVLLLNNILFVCTTYKIIKVQRSTEIATRNQRNILTKKYFLFLRLYLLMGAPWFFGMLLACFNKLIILKICRMIQPILWLLMLTMHKDIVRKVKLLFMKCKHRRKIEQSPTPTTLTSDQEK